MTTVGVLGGGQLGQMLALAGYPLGLHFRFLDPDPDAPAGWLAEHIEADFDDGPILEAFAADLDVITYEFENVPVELARALERRVPVFPPPAALEASQDRLSEKVLFRKLGIQTAPFAAVDSIGDLESAASALSYPCLLKTRRFGYDGKGQFLLRGEDDCGPAFAALGGVPLILEGLVAFERELSLLAVRSRDGATACYPLVENHHAAGMLRQSLAPAPGLTTSLQSQAESHVNRVLQALDYVGVLAVEFFEQSGRLIANEMAPRVHNSGHWTLEGSATSQFENHLRAILSLPLGSTAGRMPCAMVNLIGALPDAGKLLALPDVHLHLYGKSPRPGRKLGHVTLCAPNAELLRERKEELLALLAVHCP